MNQLNKYVYILLAVVIIFAAAFGFVLNKALTKPTIIQNNIPVLIPGKDSLIVRTVFVRDTIKQLAAVKNDTAFASFNTIKVFDKDTLKHKAEITYLIDEKSFVYEPEFELIKTNQVRVDTLKIETTKTVEVDNKSFFEEPYVNFILGVIASVTIFFLGGG